MNALAKLRTAFQSALQGLVERPEAYLEMIRPSQDEKFGDYQANFAMSIAKELKLAPRDVAQKVVEQLDVSELCHPPEIAGPGFINLKLKDSWIEQALATVLADHRLSVPPVASPRTYVVDYSSPNVAKPMHVGHIRSTVIGDSLARVLRFLGHQVVTDNHLGDWGTQFGMIIYGYKNFVDPIAYQEAPVSELARLYRLVRSIIDYHSAKRELPKKQLAVSKLNEQLSIAQQQTQSTDKAEAKKGAAETKRLNNKLKEAEEELESAVKKIAATESDPALLARAQAHAGIESAVLDQTAALHAGDTENRKLWEEFLPFCRQDIQRIYQRLGIEFDHELGESFYQPWLGEVVNEFVNQGLARESEGAQCVFLDGFETPMIIRKRDGAFLYATTDLATIRYRMQTWKPDAILYVVDHRQGEHFNKLFAAAKLWGYSDLELRHVAFGTVMGSDGKPFKTRAGDTVGLESLLDEAITRASSVIEENLQKNVELNFSAEERSRIAEVVGIGSLKYADLSQNRASDYEFSYDKMLALKGNTAPYLLYPYARVNGIFAKGGIDSETFRQSKPTIQLQTPEERRLAMAILQFENALNDVLVDYLPNLLANYLYDLTTTFSQFYERCKVLEAENEAATQTRLVLCDLLRRTVKQGLELLGIGVVERM